MSDHLPQVGAQLDLNISGASVGPYDVTPGATHFWEAVRRHELHLRRCADCGRYSHPRQEACEHCFGGNLTWEAVNGRGTVYTFSTIYRPPSADIPAPYTLGFVRLDEDVYLFTEILSEKVEIGMRVAPVFVEEPHGTLVKFKIVSSGGPDAV